MEMDPGTRYEQGWGRDIPSLALAAAEAVKVDQSAWWMMRGGGATDAPFVGLDFAVYEPKRRNLRRHPVLYCQRGVRLGPYANGALS